MGVGNDPGCHLALSDRSSKKVGGSFGPLVRVVEVMGEDGDALAAFGEVFAQEVAKQ